MRISIEKSVTALNDSVAAELRRQWRARQLFCLNIMAAPGAGKTALIEATIARLQDRFRIVVVEGDPHASLDRDRIRASGAVSVQVNTLAGCHLDARMIQNALKTVDLTGVDLLILENVGNLLCPAAWDLGEDVRVVVSSLPEGADKPFKYPETFLLAHVMVINKIDLEPFLPVTAAELRHNALRVNPQLQVFEVSCLTGDGMVEWCTWLKEQAAARKER